MVRISVGGKLNLTISTYTPSILTHFQPVWASYLIEAACIIIHTHGGQIALTFGNVIIAPARLSTMFLAGLFKIGGSHLYVNRGLGTTGPPIRINAPPEITHITLKAS